MYTTLEKPKKVYISNSERTEKDFQVIAQQQFLRDAKKMDEEENFDRGLRREEEKEKRKHSLLVS